MLACDSFHVDCAVTLRRLYVFFIIEVGPSVPRFLDTPLITDVDRENIAFRNWERLVAGIRR